MYTAVYTHRPRTIVALNYCGHTQYWRVEILCCLKRQQMQNVTSRMKIDYTSPGDIPEMTSIQEVAEIIHVTHK